MKKVLSIYIHIPFCVQKCAYCDFLSAPAAGKVQEQYLHRLMQEIKQKSIQYAKDYVVETIFIGGGTPTCVDTELLCRVLSEVKEYSCVKDDAEISMECNPGTADAQTLQRYYEAGVNRLSIGLQSTENRLLKKLGRIHTYEQFLQTYQAAREAGFTNINIDLMSALPGQTLQDYAKTLDEVLALEPEHISAYSLIVEEGTPFYEMELDVPDEDTEREMYELTRQKLFKKGYARYEISNYAKAGYACKHNQVYWQRGEYLGLGLGAASLMKSGKEEWRFKNNSVLETYLQGDFSYEEAQKLTRREAMEEFFFLGLRLMQGVSLFAFVEEYGEDTIAVFEEAIAQNIADGLLEQEGEWLRLTPKGIDVSNYVFERFIE